ncbi:MAG TPA: PhnD/SsuA/transferrin family substrate-binding protein [bacterium]|nr:PhnD/SsuA/transferrin family substrate-binding protein [bacterium]HPN44641.1 PhnD/SsuA/transferrin family substrate-binding protein [bacterium]
MKTRIYYFLVTLILFTVSLVYSQKQNDKVFIGVGFYKDIIPEANMLDVQVSLKLWAGELNKLMGLNYQTDSKIFENYQEMVEAINKQQIHLSSMSSIDYISIREQVPLSAELTVGSGIDSLNQLVLLVHKDNSIHSLADLRNKIIVIPTSSTGVMFKMWLDTELDKNNLPVSDQYFKEIKYSGKESQLVLTVFFKQNDACVVYKSVFETMKKLNPQVGKSLVIIENSPELVRSIICLTKKIDPRDRNIIINSALRLDSYSYGKQFQTLFRFDKVLPISDENIKNIEKLVSDYNSIK